MSQSLPTSPPSQPPAHPDSTGLTVPAATPGDWFTRTRELALTLTGWPSVTGTPGEQQFPLQLRNLLRSWPAFQSEPERVWTAPAGTSANLYALVRGQQPDTVILSGHFDTVGTDAYGPHAPHAFTPHALRDALLRHLDRPDLSGPERQARQDLLSGEFLPGRGLLDMKAGLAAGLAVLERYAALAPADRPVNLLLIASPDEEQRSRGARQAAADLPALTRQRGLRVRLGINLDATNDAGDGRDGQAVYLGTTGKVPVTALILGRATHASYPFDGTSAALIAAELVSRIETNPDLTDTAHAEHSPPPACLELRDGRAGYDVTTPAHVWCAFNVLTYRRSAAEVTAQILHEARGAARTALTRQAQHAARWDGTSRAAPEAAVLCFAELRTQAERQVGEARVQALLSAPDRTDDPLAESRERTLALAQAAGLSGPAVIVGLGAVHYPATHVDADLGRQVTDTLKTFTEQTGVPVRVRHHFQGISDMSFLGHRPSEADRAATRDLTPTPGDQPDRADTLSFPTVNAGPWGRDYHQQFERIHQPYSFGTLPELVWRLALMPALVTPQGPDRPD